MLVVSIWFSDVHTAYEEMYGDWQMYSFSRRHCIFKHPHDLGVYSDGKGLIVQNPGLRRRLDVGLAFVLSYFEHGTGYWGRVGAFSHLPDARWDCVDYAGIAIWAQGARRCPAKTYAARAELLDAFLEDFNALWNGQMYDYQVWKDDDVVACDSFVPASRLHTMFADIAQVVGDQPFVVKGDAAYLGDYLREHIQDSVRGGMEAVQPGT